MRRFLRLLKLAGLIFLGILGIVLIVTAACSVVAGIRLERRIAALRAAGEPLSFVDLARKPASPETNAATYLRRANTDCNAMAKEVCSIEETAPEAERKAFDNEGIVGPSILSGVRAALAAYPQVPGLLEQAANCPDYNPQLATTGDVDDFLEALLLEVQELRGAARALGYRARVQLADGQLEEALNSCVLIFRLARQGGRGPTVMSQLVALAVRGLAVHNAEAVLLAGPLPKSAYDSLNAELATHDLLQEFREALQTDRAFGLQMFRSMASNLGWGAFTPHWVKNDECGYLDAMDEYVQAAKLPYPDWERQTSNLNLSDRFGPLTNRVLPGLQSNRCAVARVQAQINALRVLGAILRREQAGNSGEVVLADLGLPPDAVIDPFNGEPLHVKKRPDGWAIYAVGKDLKDDGGILEVNSDGPDVGVGLAHIPAVEATEPERTPTPDGGASDDGK
jgi:hypothetical protein